MIARALLFASLAAGAASAQLASSTNFQLDSAGLGGAGGGACSPATAALALQDSFGDDAPLTSTNFQVEVGFQALFDVDVDQPRIVDVSPGFGTVDGGTPITICGLHFDRGGTAAPLTVDVGGQPASSVVVVSDTTVTAVTPPGSFGPADVTITTALGTTVDAGGYIYSPGLTSSPEAWQTGVLRIANYGPAGGTFQTAYSTVTTSIPLPPFGTLLIGPSPIFDAIPSTPYPASGVALAEVTVPVNPTLAGVTFHLQSVAVLSLVPLDVRLVNRSSTLFH